MAKFKDHIKQAKLPERSVSICLDQGLAAEMERLERKVADASARPDTASLEGDPKRDLREQIEALRAEMLEHSDEFCVRAMPRRAWTALLQAHPPREDDRIDALNGVNMDTFSDAMIRRCVYEVRSTDEPPYTPTAEDWTDLLGDGTEENPGVLSSGQYDKLADAGWAVNRRDVDVPFSRAVSQAQKTSASV